MCSRRWRAIGSGPLLDLKRTSSWQFSSDSNSLETMWWPMKLQPPVSRTDPKGICEAIFNNSEKFHCQCGKTRAEELKSSRADEGTSLCDWPCPTNLVSLTNQRPPGFDAGIVTLYEFNAGVSVRKRLVSLLKIVCNSLYTKGDITSVDRYTD